MSDRYGRRPALLIGLLASAAAFVVFGLADALWLLFASRLIQGAGGGTTGVAQAYIADTVEPAQRARALGWLSAATSAGVMLGPAHRVGRRQPGAGSAGVRRGGALSAQRGASRGGGSPSHGCAKASGAHATGRPPDLAYRVGGGAPSGAAGVAADLDLRGGHARLQRADRGHGALPRRRVRHQRSGPSATCFFTTAACPW